jgi:hypothetical protein
VILGAMSMPSQALQEADYLLRSRVQVEAVKRLPMLQIVQPAEYFLLNQPNTLPRMSESHRNLSQTHRLSAIQAIPKADDFEWIRLWSGHSSSLLRQVRYGGVSDPQ